MHEPCEGLGKNILGDNSMVGMGLQCLWGSEKPVWLKHEGKHLSLNSLR